MADYIDITAPVIANVSFTPNPVAAGAAVTVSATVTEEIIKRLYPTPFQFGEIQCGEV